MKKILNSNLFFWVCVIGITTLATVLLVRYENKSFMEEMAKRDQARAEDLAASEKVCDELGLPHLGAVSLEDYKNRSAEVRVLINDFRDKSQEISGPKHRAAVMAEAEYYATRQKGTPMSKYFGWQKVMNATAEFVHTDHQINVCMAGSVG